jgi:hypothetical protein
VTAFRFKFELPVRRGTDLFPNVMHAPPVVRTVVHLRRKSYNTANFNKLITVAEELLQTQLGVILNFCNSQRLNHNAGIVDFTAKRREIRFGVIEYTHLNGVETVVLHLYPEAVEDEDEDERCLLVAYDGWKLAAIPMSRLDAPPRNIDWSPIYTYSAIDEPYTPSETPGDRFYALSKTRVCQYKLGPGNYSFIYGQVIVWSEDENPGFDNNLVLGISSATTNAFEKFLYFSKYISGVDNSFRFNGDGSTIYGCFDTFTIDQRNGDISATPRDIAFASLAHFVYSDGSLDWGAAVGDGSKPDPAGPDPEWSYFGRLTARTAGFPIGVGAWFADNMPVNYSTTTPIPWVYGWWSAQNQISVNPLMVDNTLVTGSLPATTTDTDGSVTCQSLVFNQVGGVDVLGVRSEPITLTGTMYSPTSGSGHIPESTSVAFRNYSMSFTSDGALLPVNPGVPRGAIPVTNGEAHGGGRIFSPSWPPHTSQGDWTVYWGLYTQQVVDGSYRNVIVSRPDAEVSTPYGVYAGSTDVSGWLHVSNGRHYFQGFSLDGSVTNAGWRLWFDGVDVTKALPEALGTDIKFVGMVLMDIPLRRIRQLRMTAPS